MNFHSQSIKDSLEYYNSSKDGLQSSEAEQRLLKYGSNKLTDKKKLSPYIVFFNQLKDVMIIILIVAAFISALIGDLKDAVVILIIVVLNSIIGFIQEYRAEKAMEALKKMATLNALVRRDGNVSMRSATDLVPGDIVLLEAGMQVPADLRLIETLSLKIDEASLTGESHSIDKIADIITLENTPIGDRFNMAYKTTIITHGRGEGIVIATGMTTEIGRIAKLLQENESKTPLQKRLSVFGKKLSVLVLFICIIIYGAGIIRGEDPIRMLLTAISVAVAAIPEALPAIVTIALALGAKKMVHKNALIRKLPAVETLGSVTFICSDKTGTITQNKMTVSDTWQPESIPIFNNYSSERLLLLLMELNHNVIADNTQELKGDPTEIALVEFTRKSNLYDIQWSNTFQRIYELPFDSIRKRMTTIYSFNKKWLIITKGAVEYILPLCNQTDVVKINSISDNFASQGKRVLAYAMNIVEKLPDKINNDSIEHHLFFTGLVAMIDPPRPESKQAISDCHQAGIMPIMITGDHPSTAKAIAVETGIIRYNTDRMITGAELHKISEDDLVREIEHIKVYARVTPEQKLDIVKALQKNNQFVAMTGDGINDAPALKRANIGIAMGITGTDVSKEAAHMILLDDNFATIIKAVKEGRRIFDNIRKFIKYTMTSNSGEIWTIFLAPLIGLPLPLLPIHILWINLVTDGLPGLALAAEPAEDNILKRPPRKPDESIFSDGIGYHIFWVGLLMAAVCIGTQSWALHNGNEKWMTMVFTILSISQMGHAMAVRSDWKSLFNQGVFGNKQLVLSVLFTLVLQLSVIYIPFLQDIFRTQALSITELLLCLALSSIVFWAVELEKYIKRRSLKI